MKNLRPDSLFVHSGITRDPRTGASSVPIFQASTFHQEDPLHLGEYDYSRSGNPTREALEKSVAELEGGSVGLAFASGIAAISSTLMLFAPGDHLVVCADVYGGTFRVFDKLFRRWGLEVTFADASNLETFAGAITPNTKALFVETPSNPLLKITDLRKVVEIAKTHNLLTIIDNTFMSPAFQRPLDLGIDISLHSATKFLGGHSDVVAGIAVIKDPQLGKRLRFVQNAFGAILGPQDSWLVQRGIKTLGVRMERQQKNAGILAHWLTQQPEVLKVFYPGLPTHPGHAIHMSQASGGGAVLSFELASQAQAVQLMTSVKLPLVGVSLGGIETILSYPTTMSHAAFSVQERATLGISPGLVRLSLGLEDPQDIIEDITQALRNI
jgi:cystathionine beta-lyase/cystathionine gamma-synthase